MCILAVNVYEKHWKRFFFCLQLLKMTEICFGSTILKIFLEKNQDKGRQLHFLPGRQTPTLRPWWIVIWGTSYFTSFFKAWWCFSQYGLKFVVCCVLYLDCLHFAVSSLLEYLDFICFSIFMQFIHSFSNR